MPFFKISLLVVELKPYFFYVGWVFFSIGGGGGAETRGVPPFQVYLIGTVLMGQRYFNRNFNNISAISSW